MSTDARPVFSITVDFDLVPGRLVQRLNRFMALAEVNGGEVYAHLPNSGRLLTAFYPGDSAYLKRCGSCLGRKSIYSVFAVQHGGIMIIVDAQFSNLLARRVIELGLLSGLDGYIVAKENFRVGEGIGSRLDFILERSSNKFFVEVKSVTHVVDGIALFPDAPTLRG
ncbi:MAG: DNA/RNA nuclease SfsA, partial [Candidatus Bathyarchaeia archaeon]